MAIFASVCPKCNERIPVDDSRSSVFCMYCGTSLDVSQFTKGLDSFIAGTSQTVSAPSNGKDITIRGSSANAEVTLYVDRKIFCKVKKEQTVVLDLQPGKHVLMARAGFEGSEKREFDLQPGDRLEIVHNGMRGYDIIKL